MFPSPILLPLLLIRRFKNISHPRPYNCRASYEISYHSTDFPTELAFTIAIVGALSALVNDYDDTANR